MIRNIPLTDSHKMTIGVHKGEELGKIPASYLIYMYDNNRLPDKYRSYVEDNKDALMLKAKQESDGEMY